MRASFIVLAAALLVGCAGMPPLKPWPPRVDAGTGAVLFGVDAQVSNDNLTSADFGGFAMLFNRADASVQAPPAAWVVISDKNAQAPLDTLFLVTLATGDYANTTFEAVGPTLNPFTILAGNSFQYFSVRPGAVTVLGTVHASATLSRIDDRTGRYERSVTTSVDGGTKSRLIEAALQRPEAEAGGWLEALRSANRL